MDGPQMTGTGQNREHLEPLPRLVLTLKERHGRPRVKRYPTPRHRKRSRGLTNPCPIARQKRGSAGHALVLPVPRPGSNEYRFARDPRAVKAAAPNTHPAAPSPRAPLRRVPSDSQLYTVLTSGMRFPAFLCPETPKGRLHLNGKTQTLIFHSLGPHPAAPRPGGGGPSQVPLEIPAPIPVGPSV